MKKKTHEEYVCEVSLINDNIQIEEKYNCSFNKIKHRCKICDYEWFAAPFNILQGRGCPQCSGNIHKTHEQYVFEVTKKNPNIEVIDTYINNRTKIKHKCTICQYEWIAYPNNILKGQGCPQCSENCGERKIRQYLIKNNIIYVYQKIFEDCIDKRALPFDFYLPEYNICIEYQGQQHYHPVKIFGGQKSFENQVLRDKIKKEYCKRNNIFLFEISYYSDLDEELLKLYELIEAKHIEKEVIV